MLQSMGSRTHRLQWWRHVGSVVAAPGLKNTGSIVVAYLLHGIFPDQGIKPMCPALADGFFTTEPPGEQPRDSIVLVSFCLHV